MLIFLLIQQLHYFTPIDTANHYITIPNWYNKLLHSYSTLCYNNLFRHYIPTDTTSQYVTILLLIQDTNLSLSVYRYSNLKCHYNHTDMFLFSVTIFWLIQQTTMLISLLIPQLHYYTPIDTANHYINIPNWYNKLLHSYSTLCYNNLFRHYIPTDTTS